MDPVANTAIDRTGLALPFPQEDRCPGAYCACCSRIRERPGPNLVKLSGVS